MPGEDVPWPPPPREPGPWNGGPPVQPPGNTPLPPLPGSGGVVHGATTQTNPWAGTEAAPPSGPPPTAGTGGWSRGVPQVAIPPQRTDPFPGLPTQPKLVDRAPLWVLIASAIVVVALIAGAGFVLLKGGRQYPAGWDARVAPITTWVAEERDLDFKHPVKVNFLSDKEYSALATEGGDDDSAETKQYYDDQLAQLRALGFVSGDVDLAQASDTLSDSGTLAYYDPSVEQVFVRGTKMTPALKVTLAHELTHVLQDQHFDLERFEELGSGKAAVLRALAEGDATKVEDAYIEQLSDADAKAYEEESSSGSDDAQEEIDEKVPPILTTIFASPYILGPELISYLDEKGGWEAIDEVLVDPPTEEAMFDPTTYQTDAAGSQTVEIEPPAGSELIETSEFGPTTWYLLLASRLDPLVALKAADGWGGDQYVVYRKDDKVCLNATIQGDTEADTTELAAALGSWAQKSAEGTAEVTNEDGAVQFRSCDPGKEAEGSGEEVTPDLLTLPVVRTQVYTQAIQADRTPKQAKCYANGIVEAFSIDQLNDPEGAEVNSKAGQQKIEGIGQECFT